MSNEEPRLRVGVVGLGMAGHANVRSILAHPSADVVAAADVNPSLRDRIAADLDVPTFETVDDLCAEAEVDVVWIATPHQFHKDNVLSAARAGVHVIVEKPLSLTLEECDDMIRAVDESGIKLIVGHTESYAPAVQKMRAVIESGELGPLEMITTMHYNEFLYRPRRPEELDTSKGGGIIFNQVPHQVDMVRYLGGGSVRSVRAYTGAWDESRPTEGSCMALLDFEDGVAASVTYNGYDHFSTSEFYTWLPEERHRAAGDYGAARRQLAAVASQAEEAKQRVDRYAYGGEGFPRTGDQPHFGVTIVSCRDGDMRPWANGVAVYDADGRRLVEVAPSASDPGRSEVLDEIADAIFRGKPPVHTARWAKATMEVCLGILQSSRERREVVMAHQVGLPRG